MSCEAGIHPFKALEFLGQCPKSVSPVRRSKLTDSGTVGILLGRVVFKEIGFPYLNPPGCSHPHT